MLYMEKPSALTNSITIYHSSNRTFEFGAQCFLPSSNQWTMLFLAVYFYSLSETNFVFFFFFFPGTRPDWIHFLSVSSYCLQITSNCPNPSSWNDFNGRKNITKPSCFIKSIFSSSFVAVYLVQYLKKSVNGQAVFF